MSFFIFLYTCVLKFSLFYMNIATPTFSSFPYACNILFHHITVLCILPWSGFLSGNILQTVFVYFIFLYFFKLYNIVLGFAIYQHESATGIHMFPILNPPPSSPPHTLPLGRSSAPAPSIQYRALNLDWWLVSYMILYMFQCHSPKSSHPLPLPQSPKDYSIHQCLFCCLVYRVVVTIFLNSIYMH